MGCTENNSQRSVRHIPESMSLRADPDALLSVLRHSLETIQDIAFRCLYCHLMANLLLTAKSMLAGCALL